LIRLGRPDVGADEIAAVVAVLRSGNLVQGEQVAAFEASLAGYVGVRHAVATSSGTAALHLTLLALGIGPGDEVVVPDFTHPATANVVERIGARAVLVDIDLATYNVDVEDMRRAITPRTRAVMPVHLFGFPAAMDAVQAMAQEHGLPIVEDAACALGASYRGRRCGTLGRAACFSFHPRKVITTGEGGMVTTDDDTLAASLRMLRSHGAVPAAPGRLRFEAAGLNYRMTDFQAALGLVQMSRLDTLLLRREAIAEMYTEHLAAESLVHVPRPAADSRPVWQSYVVRLEAGIDRDRIQRRMAAAGVETTIGTYALSAEPAYASRAAACPHSIEAAGATLSLPMHTGLSDGDVATITAELRRAIAQDHA
jgi:perosamine synthetase